MAKSILNGPFNEADLLHELRLCPLHLAHLPIADVRAS